MTPSSKLSYREVTLTKGQVSIVDDADYEWLNQWNWQAGWYPKIQAFYAQRAIYHEGNQTTVLMHRQILGLEQGDNRQSDHIRPNSTLDNRRSNLRIATHGQNNQNKGLQRNNRSGVKGVYFHKPSGLWRAMIKKNTVRRYLGDFKNIEDAAEAYAEAARVLHGEFARIK